MYEKQRLRSSNELSRSRSRERHVSFEGSGRRRADASKLLSEGAVESDCEEDVRRQHAFGLREARDSLIAIIQQLPPACRDYVLDGEARRPRIGRARPYEHLQACVERLVEYVEGHNGEDLSRVLEEARRFNDRMNREREALIMGNLGIVSVVAKGAFTGVIPLTDLVQDGYIGLLKAVDRFDPDRGYKFSTYACWWIRRALNEAFHYRRRFIRLPDSVRRELKQMHGAMSELKARLGRDASDQELANHMIMSLKKVKRLRSVVPDAIALEDLGSDRGDGWSALLAGSSAPDPFETTLRDELREHAKKALEQLNPREQTIIKARFGFDDQEIQTLRQIACQLGLSRERVRQIESEALEKIERWAKKTGIGPH